MNIGRVAESARFSSSIDRVFFMPENHSSASDRQINAEFLRQQYNFERGDVILVEDDESKPAASLNVSQLGDFCNESCRVEGWDDHYTCLKSAMIIQYFSMVNNAVAELASDAFPLGGENYVIHLRSFVTNFKVTVGDGERVEVNNEFFKNPDNTKRKNQLLQAISGCMTRILGNLAYQHFPISQKAMLNKIQQKLKCAENSYVFVMAGQKHFDTTDDKIGHIVTSFFDALQVSSRNNNFIE